jgi:hypothetical protein
MAVPTRLETQGSGLGSQMRKCEVAAIRATKRAI